MSENTGNSAREKTIKSFSTEQLEEQLARSLSTLIEKEYRVDIKRLEFNPEGKFGDDSCRIKMLIRTKPEDIPF